MRAPLAARYPGHFFAGRQTGEALAEHYASADLFLFPSLTETWGNVITEAMASGLPVVAFRRGAAATCIRDGLSGIAVAPGDEHSFISAARRLAEDDRLRARLGMAARQEVLAWDWDAVAALMERELLALVR